MEDAQRIVLPLKMVSKGMILVVILLLVVLYPLARGGIAQDLTITVIHANNVNGHLFACPT